MKRNVLPNGKVQLLGQIKDKRLGKDIIHSEVVCNPEDEKFYYEETTQLS